VVGVGHLLLPLGIQAVEVVLVHKTESAVSRVKIGALLRTFGQVVRVVRWQKKVGSTFFSIRLRGRRISQFIANQLLENFVEF
jgi:hypothetical protein